MKEIKVTEKNLTNIFDHIKKISQRKGIKKIKNVYLSKINSALKIWNTNKGFSYISEGEKVLLSTPYQEITKYDLFDAFCLKEIDSKKIISIIKNFQKPQWSITIEPGDSVCISSEKILIKKSGKSCIHFLET